MLGTTVIYAILTFGLIYLCNISKRRRNNRGIIAAYMLLTFMSVVRFDVGWDYQGYSRVVTMVCDSGFSNGTVLFITATEKIFEPFFIILCYVFRNMDRPYLWVFGCYAILTILFLFMAVNHDGYKKMDPDKNKWSLVAIVIFYFLFFMWDVQRQGLALAIVLYAYKYAQKGSLLKFLLTIVLACMAHLSAFLAIPLYFLTKLRFKKEFAMLLVLGMIFLYVIGAFQVLNWVAELVPYFKNYADDERYMSNFYGFSLFMLLKFIMWILVVSQIPPKQGVLGVAFTFGVAVYIMASGAQVFERVGDYYYYSIILLFPQMIKQAKKEKFFLYMAIGIVTFVCFYDMAITQKRGVMPYQTIWSDNYRLERFKDKIEYK